MKKKFKRKVIVNPRLQLGWALFVAALQVPGILITGFIMSWFYLIYMDNNLAVSYNTSSLVVLTVSGLLLIAGVTVFIARRTTAIAGPIKKLRILMAEMAQGHPPENPIIFRKGDWFSELENDLNAMSRTLSQSNETRSHTRQTLEQLRADLKNNQEIKRDKYLETIDRLMAELS